MRITMSLKEAAPSVIPAGVYSCECTEVRDMREVTTADGVVNVMDMIQIQRCVLAIDSGAACARSDVNRDGAVSVLDMIKVQRAILGMDICA